MQVGFASQAFKQGDFCGDQVGYWVGDSMVLLCVVDGLGHGPEAERAARTILDFVSENIDASPQSLFKGADEAARSTRGAAVGLVYVDRQEESFTYVGVGNTRAMFLDGRSRAARFLYSTNGIVGAGYQPLIPEKIFFDPRSLLFLYTDGFPTQIDAAQLSHLQGDPASMADEFLERFTLGTDDAAVLVARLESRV